MDERIRKIIVENDMTLSLFVNATGIHPTTLSHILNGREVAGKGKVKQKPSADVQGKILAAFPNINPEWLLFGKGAMYKGQRTFVEPELFPVETATELPIIQETPEYRQETEDKVVKKETEIPQKQAIIPELSLSENIDKIIIFFKNKTFVTLKPEE